MVRNGNVLVAESRRSFRHFTKRCLAVRRDGMHVKIPAQILPPHQVRERAVLRRFQFAGVLAQLGRNPFITQTLVNYCFALACNPFVVV